MPTPNLAKEEDVLLHSIYYDKHIYFGRDKIFKYIQTNYPDSKISRRQVMNWLKDREVQQLFAPKKETKDIKRTILDEPYKQIGIDLIDMTTKQVNNIKWI